MNHRNTAIVCITILIGLFTLYIAAETYSYPVFRSDTITIPYYGGDGTYTIAGAYNKTIYNNMPITRVVVSGTAYNVKTTTVHVWLYNQTVYMVTIPGNFKTITINGNEYTKGRAKNTGGAGFYVLLGATLIGLGAYLAYRDRKKQLL